MNMILFAFFVLSFLVFSFAYVNQSSHGLADFNFAAVGDFGCNVNTDATVTNIRNKNPELVLALGDYSYQATADCWLTKIQPIESITKINIGNHEDTTSEGLNQYKEHFGLTSTFYSFDYQNVHILTMTWQSNYEVGSSQYNFVLSDLQAASQDPEIDWIVVSVHDWIYRSSSSNARNDDFSEVYHPIFDQYNVDLVLSGHDHKYHRTFPIEFNPNNPDNPIIFDNNPNNYVDPEGQIYAVAGAGGVNLIPLDGTSSFVASQNDDFFGQLDIKFTNNGAKLEGRYYKNGDNTILDSFSITKSDATGIGTYHFAPGLVLEGDNFLDEPNSSSLQLNEFSVAAWFKTSTNFANEAFIVNKGGIGSESTGQNQNYQISMTSAERIKAGFETSTGADQFVTSPNTYNDGQWHYAVVTNDGTTLRLYIDGVQVATKATAGAAPESSGIKPVRIGANSRVIPPSNFFTGEVDEVRIWSDDLTAQQVLDASAGTSFNSAEQILHIAFGSSPPIANNQDVLSLKNTEKPLTLTATDPDSPTLNYVVVTQPENGTLSGTAPNLIYSPAPNFVGTDSFTFKANDGTTDSNIATVSITVNEPRPPVAKSQNITLNKNSDKSITLVATDPDSPSLNYTVVTQPLSGTLSGTAPNLIYSPTPNFVGTDSFTFKANDGITDSNVATVSIEVQEGYQYTPGLILTGSNYHEAQNSPSLQLSQFSVAAWFKTSASFSGEGFIVNKGGIGSDSAGQNQNYQISMTGSEQIKAGFETSTGVDHYVTTANTYNDGDWHYAVVTNDGSRVILYIDGVQVAMKSTAGASPESSGTKPVRIGANSRVTPPTTNFFTGEVDEVRIWNDDLTAQQVSDAFAGNSFNTPEMVLHFPFDGGVGGYQYAPAFTLTGSNYNDTPSSISLQLSQFSVAAWFKTSTNFAAEVFILNKGGIGSESAGQNQNYQLSMTSSERMKVGFETSTGADQFVTSPSAYNDGQWHYAVVTNSGNNLVLYVDGVQVATKSTAGASPESSGTKPVRIGANSRVTPPTSNFFTGEVDEVRIWNDDLTAQEVSNAFAGTNFNTADQVLHLGFSSATITGSYVYDPSLSLSGPP
jgi:Concanavalin A-like lectin/glucanases superfamily/Bacterial Ig domain/Calcineurin-like phosphoesterase